jgi:hypothetical protein
MYMCVCGGGLVDKSSCVNQLSEHVLLNVSDA